MTAEEIIVRNQVFPNTSDSHQIPPEFRKYLEFCIKLCMQEYAKLKCAEQRQICANEAYADYNFVGIFDKVEDVEVEVYVIKSSILNAPEPNI